MKSVLIIGLGRFGLHMARKLTERGNEVLAVDNCEERVNDAMRYVTDAQIGDSTNENFIETLGVDNFDLCVVAIGDDFQNSLETVSLLKDYGAKFVVARAVSDVHSKFLLRNGADRVVYAEKEMGERLAMTYGSETVFDYVELTPDYSIYEISVPEAWIGKSIAGAEIRQKYNLNILGIKKDEVLQPMPGSAYVFEVGDKVLAMGHNNDFKKIIKD